MKEFKNIFTQAGASTDAHVSPKDINVLIACEESQAECAALRAKGFNAYSSIKILHQTLKAKWYKMIEAGEKTEEYREPGLYWCQRIQPCPCPASREISSLTPTQHLGRQYCIHTDLPCAVTFDIYARRYTHVQFSLGYPKKNDASRRMTFELKAIEYREGREEWGAEKGKKYLVEVLGRRTTLDGTKLWEEF